MRASMSFNCRCAYDDDDDDDDDDEQEEEEKEEEKQEKKARKKEWMEDPHACVDVVQLQV